MIGILTITHSNLGHTLVETAESILNEKIDYIYSVSVNFKQKVDDLRERILKSIEKVNRGKGVIVLTDMFGGTPSNLSYSFLEEGKIEVVSGVNLPMIIRAIKERQTSTLSDLALDLEIFGKKSISLASGILKGNKRR